MKKVVLLVLAAIVIPGSALAYRDCPGCVLGLFDDEAMTQSFGSITPFVLKSIYLGIKYSTPETGLSGIEFSIAGINPNVLWIQGLNPVSAVPSITVGNTLCAPTDPSQRGGLNIAWGSCMSGSRALLRLDVVWMDPTPPSNLVLQVQHRYPPSNPLYGLAGPIFTDCTNTGPDQYVAVRITGGSYVLNPVVQVQVATWSNVKGLYR